MKALRRLGFKSAANPCVSREAGRRHLAQLFAELGFRKGAEIGVWTGLFAEQLCQANYMLHLTCVDAWQQYDGFNDKKNDQARLTAAYRETVDRLSPHTCTILRMTSEEAAARIPDGSLDFVYIDANHAEAYVRKDLELWTPKVRSGGIVAGHDYIVGTVTKKHAHLQVRAAVDAFAAERDIAPIYVFARDASPSFAWVVA